jgi:phosphatidylglycerophosphate synthase
MSHVASSTSQRGLATPARPKFSWKGAIGWFLYPVIDRVCKRLCLNGKPSYLDKVPNWLTGSRAFFPIYGPAFMLAVINHMEVLATLLLLVIVAAYLTDAVDGELARYLNVETQWGQFWDPVFDKIAGVSMLLTWGFVIHNFDKQRLAPFVWLALARISLDAVLAFIAWREKVKGLDPKAHLWGKVKSTVDVVAVLLGCIGGLIYAFGGAGDGLIVVGLVALIIAICPLAPLSIGEHLIHFRRKQSK